MNKRVKRALTVAAGLVWLAMGIVMLSLGLLGLSRTWCSRTTPAACRSSACS
jgi:hypothetical protein